MPRGKATAAAKTTLTKARAAYGSKQKAGKARGGTTANMNGPNWKTLKPQVETILKQNNRQLMTTLQGEFTKASSAKSSAATS